MLIPLGETILRYRGEGLSRVFPLNWTSETEFTTTKTLRFSHIFAIFLYKELWKSQIKDVIHKKCLKPAMHRGGVWKTTTNLWKTSNILWKTCKKLWENPVENLESLVQRN